MGYNIPESAMAEFYAEAEEILGRVSLNLSKLESSGLSQELIDSLYRDIHTLKGSSQLFGFTDVGLVSHALESCLEPIRSRRMILTSTLVTGAFSCLDLIDKMLKSQGQKIDFAPAIQKAVMPLINEACNLFGSEYHVPNDRPLFFDSLKEIKNSIGNSPALKNDGLTETKPQPAKITPSASKVSPSKAAPAPSLKVKAKTIETREVTEIANVEASSIRVQVGLLDRLMNLVGEMVLVRNQVLQYSSKNNDYEFQNLSQRLDLVTGELQEDIMKTRMQPIGGILNKFQRVVRDIAREVNKEIEVSIKGAETELDKSLLEAIKDPLTHIIRNSCDHGLETTDERLKAGKSDSGQIQIKAYHESGQVVIEVSDDGRGLNLPKIISKAIEKKIITRDQASSLSEKEVGQLIFAPGFSTADQVSALSGRGVGMDVVKTNIEKVGGLVDLTSETGKGTTIRLRIPLTLAVVPAMIVESSKELFAIPQVKLQELVRVDMDSEGQKIEYLQGQPILRLRGNLVPIVFMNKELSLSSKQNETSIFNIVILNSEEQAFGLVVDEIKDTADIVVKPLPPFLKRLNLFSGATIMGDGTVALILDVMGLGEKSRVLNNVGKKEAMDTLLASRHKALQKDTQEMLFFSLNAPGQYCLPLMLVQRLEEFPFEQIQTSGEERIVKYRESILPLISLNQYLGLAEETPKSFDPSDKISVIVVSKRRRSFGIEVNSIFDVNNFDSDIETPLQEAPGILGNILTDHGIATVIDILGIIDSIVDGTELSSRRDPLPLQKLQAAPPLKILLVEDTPFFVKQVQKVLRQINAEVTHAPDGEAALKLLRSSKSDRFDLVITDIEMPYLDGFQLTEHIRADATWKKIPVMALTTRFREVDVQRGLQIGFNRYLEKLKPEELIDAIQHQFEGMSA